MKLGRLTITAIKTLPEFIHLSGIALQRSKHLIHPKYPQINKLRLELKWGLNLRFFICMQHCILLKKCLMNAFTVKKQLVDEDKKVETANFAARQKDNFNEKHLNGKVV